MAARKPLPRDPVERVTALLERTRAALLQRAYRDLYRAMAPGLARVVWTEPDHRATMPAFTRWRAELARIEGSCRMILSVAFELDARLTEELRRASWSYGDKLGPPVLGRPQSPATEKDPKFSPALRGGK